LDIGNRYRLGIEGMLEVGDGVGNCEKPSQSVGDGAVPPPPMLAQCACHGG